MVVVMVGMVVAVMVVVEGGGSGGGKKGEIFGAGCFTSFKCECDGAPFNIEHDSSLDRTEPLDV